jgi:acyl carrier protein phosphodiesterase
VNYLAHAYLSFGRPQVLVGNMISDHVKGRSRYSFPPLIQHGIELHRRIDEFTDRHETTKEAKEIFRPHYRLYSGALVDVIYDHFLAIDPEEFTEQSLLEFSLSTYRELNRHAKWFPERFAILYPYMQSQNWLYHYRQKDGISKSLHGVVRRAKYLTESQTAFGLFETNYQLLESIYRQFWQEVKPFAEKELNGLSGSD